jgi:hypothetical protein
MLHILKSRGLIMNKILMFLLLLPVLFYGCSKDDGVFTPSLDEEEPESEEDVEEEPDVIIAELNTKIYIFEKRSDNKAEIKGFIAGDDAKEAIKSIMDKNNGVFLISGNIIVPKTESEPSVNAAVVGGEIKAPDYDDTDIDIDADTDADKFDYIAISSIAYDASVPDEISALLTDIEIGDNITFNAGSFKNFKSLEGLKANATVDPGSSFNIYFPPNIKRLDISKINRRDISGSFNDLRGNSIITEIVFPHGLIKIHEQSLRDLVSIKVMDFSKVEQHIDSDYKCFNNCPGNIIVYLPEDAKQYVGGTAGTDSFIEGEWPNGLSFLFSDTSTIYIGNRLVKDASEPIGNWWLR